MKEEVVNDLVRQFKIGTLDEFKGEGKQSGFSKLAAATKSTTKTLKKVAKKTTKIINSLKLRKKQKLVPTMRAN